MKKKLPHDHTGKIIPIDTLADRKAALDKHIHNLENGGSPRKPELERYRKTIKAIIANEKALLKDEPDRQVFRDRITGLAEALAMITFIENLTKNNPITVSDALLIAEFGIGIGSKITVAEVRQIEPYAFRGYAEELKGQKQQEENRRKNPPVKFNREELLKKLSDKYRQYPGYNHKEVCSAVGDDHNRSQRHIEEQCKVLSIRSADYRKKTD